MGEVWTIRFKYGNVIHLTNEEYVSKKASLKWFDGDIPDLFPLEELGILSEKKWFDKKEAILYAINTNIRNMFLLQKRLDNVILGRFENLKYNNNLFWKVNALQAEIGELLQEWQGFKMWKVNKIPKIRSKCFFCDGYGQMIEQNSTCPACDGMKVFNPILEEYIDCLHFLLSIGLEVNVEYNIIEFNPFSYEKLKKSDLNEVLFRWVRRFYLSIKESIFTEIKVNNDDYGRILSTFIAIGFILGFGWNEIVRTYVLKNKKNHERQNNYY